MDRAARPVRPPKGLRTPGMTTLPLGGGLVTLGTPSFTSKIFYITHVTNPLGRCEVGPASLASSTQSGPTLGAQSGDFQFVLASICTLCLIRASRLGPSKNPRYPGLFTPFVAPIEQLFLHSTVWMLSM
jgi:hypothetical protein